MSTHQPEPGSRKQELFLEAVEIDNAHERAAVLEAACGDNAELRAAVEALVRYHHDDGFLEQPALAIEDGRTAASAPVTELPGDRIGRYKLLDRIGEGGCGVVYRAEQEEPVRRRVALKVIKPGMDSKPVIARSGAKRQALAMMDHPNIARVFDGGHTGEGVMSVGPSGEIERVFGPCFAAPLVSGVCALMAPLRPDLTQVDARPFLGAGADDQAGGLGDPQGFDPQHGRERVNAFHSLRLATTQIDVVHRSATGLELSWPSPPSAANIAPWQVYRLAPACDRDSDRWHGNAHRFLCRQFQPPLLPGGFPTVIVHSSLPPLIVCLATAIAGTRGTWEIDAALRTGAPRN